METSFPELQCQCQGHLPFFAGLGALGDSPPSFLLPVPSIAASSIHFGEREQCTRTHRPCLARGASAQGARSADPVVKRRDRWLERE